MKFSVAGQEKGDLLIEVTTLAGFTLHLYAKINKLDNIISVLLSLTQHIMDTSHIYLITTVEKKY